MSSPSMRRRRPIARLLAAFLALGLVATACGSDDKDSNSDGGTKPGGDTPITSTTAVADVEEVTTGGTLVIALEAETATWTPGGGSFSSSGYIVARSIYDPIAARGADGDIYPYLAESIETNDDLTEWTITLPENVKFHDGTDLTAEVMKTIFDEYLSVEGANTFATAQQVEEVRVDGPLTYTYVLKEGSAAFVDHLQGPMGWPFSVEACRAAGDDCGSKPVGTGPFVFQSWTRDFELRATRNENYWRTDENGNQLPYLDEVVFRPTPDEDSRVAAVLAGDAQAGHTLRQSAVQQVMAAESAGNVKAYLYVGNNSGSAIINTSVPPTDDVRVRRAMAFALDQEALVKILGGEGISPAQSQYFSSDSPWYSQKVADAWPTNDPEAARALVEEYKNDPERSDGKPVGDPISFVFNCPPDPSLMAVSQGYQAMWEAVGIETTYNGLEQATHITKAVGSADTTPPFVGDYQAACWRLGSQNDPYTELSTQFEDEFAPGNVTNYTSDNVKEQLEILRSNTDFQTRYNAVENIMLEFAENVPNTWTGATATAIFSAQKVRNLSGWTIPGGIQGGGTPDARTFLTEVWMEK